MTYATEEERIEAKRASRRRAYGREKAGVPLTVRAKQHEAHERPKKGNYPAVRAPRVDRSKMTEEEWLEHKRVKGLEKCALWNARNPGKSNAALRKRRAENPEWDAVQRARERAKVSGLEFTLDNEWAHSTYTGVCVLTGIPFVISALAPAGKSGIRPYSPSIDRINPLQGYTPDNCRWVLMAVNSFKLAMSDAEMLHIARALLAYAEPETPR